jgi:hypothetical protein
MNPNWRSFLESADGVFDGETSELLNFGDASGELLAASRQTVLVPLTHLGLIEAAGEEAKTFLHSQFTSDINHLADGQVQHSGWCQFSRLAIGRQLSAGLGRRPPGGHTKAPADVRVARQSQINVTD